MTKKTEKQTENDSPIKSQAKAAKIAGVSRQALSGMCKKDNSQFRFFTSEGKVDTSSPDWTAYLESRTNGIRRGPVPKLVENNPQERPAKKRRDEVGKESSVPRAYGWDREHSLTGGFDPAQFVPTNPAQLKSLTDIVARNIEMRIKLGDLISREIVDSYISKIQQCVTQFVSLSRSVSTDICEKLDRVGMEREVEKMINPKIKSIIDQIVEACNNAKK